MMAINIIDALHMYERMHAASACQDRYLLEVSQGIMLPLLLPISGMAHTALGGGE